MSQLRPVGMRDACPGGQPLPQPSQLEGCTPPSPQACQGADPTSSIFAATRRDTCAQSTPGRPRSAASGLQLPQPHTQAISRVGTTMAETRDLAQPPSRCGDGMGQQLPRWEPRSCSTQHHATPTALLGPSDRCCCSATRLRMFAPRLARMRGCRSCPRLSSVLVGAAAATAGNERFSKHRHQPGAHRCNCRSVAT